jgi:ubiquitin-protein ligase E3 C
MQMLNDLADVDYFLYKNLLFLQRCDDATAVEELGLGFAVSHLDLGTQREVELMPGGAQVPVTSTNRLNYIHLVAKHHVVDRLALQSQAFCRGFHQVVSPGWLLRIFNQCELQMLVSGSISGGWDVEDLRNHCRYGQGYRGADKSVRRLWHVLLEFDDQQRRQFMRFVTSSERAPLGGFANLDPPFTIIRVPLASGDEQRLPTARTCFNELLWPAYSSKQTAKAKLLQAISSGAGFELS